MNTADGVDESPVFAGERAIEGTTPPDIWQEHVARYQFSSHFARGRVLDIACGTGYRCKILLNRATTRIVGIDISQDAISLASKRYKDDRIAFMVGNILNIELPNGSQDVITCFETIEHVAEQGMAMSELCRVLNPNGILIISTPNRKAMPPGSPVCSFHVNEFSTEEFVSFLRRHFGTVTVFGQRGVNKLLYLPFVVPFARVIRHRLAMLLSFFDANVERVDRVERITSVGSSNLESLSPLKEYLYVTAVCGRPRMR